MLKNAMYSKTADSEKGLNATFGLGVGVGRGRGFGNVNPQPQNPGWNASSTQPMMNNYSNSKSGAVNNADDDQWDDTGSSWNEAPKSQNWQGEVNWNAGGDNNKSSGSDWNSSSRNNKTSSSDWNSSSRNNKTSGSDWNSSSRNNKTSGSDWNPQSGNERSRSQSNNAFGSNFSSDSDEFPRGGGMKSRSGGKGCFKCGEEGHMSRECPNNGGGNRGDRRNACFKCGEEGHMSRECPSNGGGNRGDRKNACFKCGEEGHMSRECPNNDGNRGDRKNSCFKCGEEGHLSRDCPNSGGGGNRGDKKSGCFKCGEDGHMSRECPNPDTRLGPDGKPRQAPYIPPDPEEDENTLFEGVPTGINFDKYDTIPVNVSGMNAPKPIRSFQEANFRNLLQANVNKSHYTRPTPIQKYAIPIILQKRDLMACAQTGSGKTAAFLLPMLQQMFEASDLPNNSYRDKQEPWAIIISPTRELAIQIFNEARKFAHGSIVKVELIYGGTSVSHQSSRLQKGCHVLVATPGRLLDFVEKGKLSFKSLKYLVLDEADRMLDMGFLPCVQKMVEDPEMPPKGERQTLMFSATFPETVQELASEFLDNYLFLTVGVVGAANADVEQSIFQISQFDKRNKLMEIVSGTGNDRILVFVELKRTADFIASFMSQSGLPTTSIHGDRMQREREEALRDFRIGRMPILVATAVAARGLDIKDVRHVINYDLPQSIDEYVHRIGRTGRVGNIGIATSFYDSEVDRPLARSLVKILQEANQVVPAWLLEEASSAIGTETSYSGRGRFGARDVRTKGNNSYGGGGNWNSNNNNDFCNVTTNEPVYVEDSWD